MPRGDGRRWVTYNAPEQNERRMRGEAWVPWGYFVTRGRQGVRSGPIHHHCAVERLESVRELPASGGRNLRLDAIDYRGAPRLRDLCVVCETPLINTRWNYRLRVVPAPSAITNNVCWAVPLGWSQDDLWTVEVPASLAIASIQRSGLFTALVAMREAMPAEWGVAQARYDNTYPDSLPEGAIPPRDGRLISFESAVWDGLDGTVAHEHRIQRLVQAQASHDASLANYRVEIAQLQEAIAAGALEIERQRSVPGERIPRSRLAAFLDTLGAVRSWELNQGLLTLNLWPVKLYNDATGVTVMTTPHTWTVEASPREGFSIAVSGAHPHWRGRRYCPGNYAEQLQELLSRGNIFQALRMLLELRRGWSEQDQYVDTQSVCTAAFTQFSRNADGFQFYEDGRSGEILPFVKAEATMIGRRRRG